MKRPVLQTFAAHVAACAACRGVLLCPDGRRLELAAQLEASGWQAVARAVLQ